MAFFTSIGEDALVALDAVRMFIPEHVSLTGQGFVALPATEVSRMPILVHRLGVFPTIVGRSVGLLDFRHGDFSSIFGFSPSFGGLLDLSGLGGGELHLYVNVGHRSRQSKSNQTTRERKRKRAFLTGSRPVLE